MRICFFIATKKGTAGAVLHSAPNLFKIQPEKEGGDPEGPPWLLYTPGGDHTRAVKLYLFRLKPHDGSEDKNPVPIVIGGSTWTVWLLIPDSLEWDMGPRAMRKLIRARFDDNVLGPYTKPEIQRKRPALHDLLCPDGGLPHNIQGDDPVALGALDYAPSQLDSDNDVEPTKESIFGPEPIDP